MYLLQQDINMNISAMGKQWSSGGRQWDRVALLSSHLSAAVEAAASSSYVLETSSSKMFYQFAWILSLVLFVTCTTNNSGFEEPSDGVTYLTSEEVAALGNITLLLAPPANCAIEKHEVSLRRHKDLSEVYFPRSTRIDRCGGSCVQPEIFICAPYETELVYYRVFIRRYLGGKKYSPPRTEFVSVVKHLKCGCTCRRKAKDCSPLQVYKESECACVCTNDDDKKKCLAESGTKYWNAQKCECNCLYKSDCVTGFSWNKHTCSCMPLLTRRTNYAAVPN
ncbi:uncharacterized protein LOC106671136 [Cimex lectularius]|uniref:Platelet-derived growth factor (PDGF) family profile domain-containing protein n=1 Tax=Cimex lectularius TaxID=79782 RepID=A0A8I6TJX3_CIMLE|nr:uncharacterized protein LOC106671136 [Cimex lectularius]